MIKIKKIKSTTRIKSRSFPSQLVVLSLAYDARSTVISYSSSSMNCAFTISCIQHSEDLKRNLNPYQLILGSTIVQRNADTHRRVGTQISV